MQSQTVTFRDGSTQWSVAMSGDDSTRMQTVHGDVSLQEFFARPVPIWSQTWVPNTAFVSETINPWQLFIENPRVSNRMSNYALMAGKLHVKLMVNGNSFYYGRIMASYQPLWLTDQVAFDNVSGGAELMIESQRMKLFVDPCESQAGTMELPFMWYKDMVNITTTDYLRLGAIRFIELQQLKHANAATTPVTITAYAWIENIKLSAPTAVEIAGLVPQGNDEYSKTPVSALASSVAKLAGSYARVPYIGKYARATQIASGAMAQMASLFGFSRPTVISTPTVMRHRNVGELAVTDVPDTSNKLSIDSKQELSVDPNILGLSSMDELAISSIASRETYCTTFAWPTAAAQNAPLISMRVSPNIDIATVGSLGTYYTIPALSFAAQPFTYWRGSLRYRFQIVASAYHKGRLMFVWDPVAGTTVPENNVAYTKIVDIGCERDFVMDVPWGSDRTWLKVINPGTAWALPGGVFTTSDLTVYNGVLTVYVLNELTTPNSAINNDIAVNVFVSACDFEVCVPHNRIKGYSSIGDGGSELLRTVMEAEDKLEPQGDTEKETEDIANAPEMAVSAEEMADCHMMVNNLPSVYMGEVVSSMRTLMKRYAVDYIYAAPTASAGLLSFSASDFPMKYGYTPYGLRGVSPNFYNVANTTIMRYLAFAYIAFRGGVRRKYMLSTALNNSASHTLTVSRNSDNIKAPLSITGLAATAVPLSNQLLAGLPSGLSGMHMTSLKQNGCVEVEIPFYTPYRFVFTRGSYDIVSSDQAVEALSHNVTTTVLASGATYITAMVAGAEDASFFCFQGCAPFYINPTLI